MLITEMPSTVDFQKNSKLTIDLASAVKLKEGSLEEQEKENEVSQKEIK